MSLNTWDAPTGAYTSSIPPGTRAFRAYVAAKFRFTRTEVVRDQSRCRNTKSEHCECGAIDFFTTNLPFGREVFDWCVAVADPAGVQSVIFNRRVIGFGDPRERRYTGPSPHTDHVHVGLNRWARANLTQQMLAMMDPDQEDDVTPEQAAQLQRIEDNQKLILTYLGSKDPDAVGKAVGRGDILSDVDFKVALARAEGFSHATGKPPVAPPSG